MLWLASRGAAETDWTAVAIAATVAGVFNVGLAVAVGIHFAGRAEKVVGALHHLAEGDFTVKLSLSGRDDFAWLAYEYDCARKALRQLITELSEHARNVSESSVELAGASREISESTRKQSEAASSVAAAVEEMAVSVNHVADNAREARSLTDEAGQASREGTTVIGGVVTEVTNIATAVQESSSVIENLGHQSAQIRSIVKVIDDVARQTNLLALNAAIEAARAGEQGRGFAVVADEVRKLAERTASSTREIGAMIETIGSGTAQAVESMQRGVAKVENGVRLAREAGSSITAIDQRTQRVVETVTDISTAIEEQRSTTNEIARHIEDIARMAESNSDATRRTGETAERLSGLSSGLQTSVSRFRI
jgi:methyl-accepting chemotaxis protein